MQTPRWVETAVFYQIFPDRFARGSRRHLPRGLQLLPWGSPPEAQGYQGGDLYGVIEKLDYLQSFGINAIYLNPIFASASNHRYHTYDYFQVDPLLGGNEALSALLEAAHQRGMKVVLDGVFNHASRGFWAFHHILENGETSPYLDWFHVEEFPLNPYPKHGDDPHNYRAWWDIPALPKFNTDNPGVRDYLFSVAEYWVEKGIDGWRLDVPGDIDDDSFWQTFRQRVKAINPDAYIVGEIWDDASRWLQGDQFDAVMNYPLGTAALGYFAASVLRDYEQNHFDVSPREPKQFLTEVQNNQRAYPAGATRAQLNVIDSHDTPRMHWLTQGHSEEVALTLAFVGLMPGAPCLYYGTEAELDGANDPYCREAMPWDAVTGKGESIRNAMKMVSSVRGLSGFAGTDATVEVIGEDIVSLRRQGEQLSIRALFNRSSLTKEVIIKKDEPCLNLLDETGVSEKNSKNMKIILPAKSFQIFVS